jgi:hypothetical protein
VWLDRVPSNLSASSRIGTPAPHHIFVSKDFKVTGTS